MWFANVELPVDSLADGTYAFRFALTDCADQTTLSDAYYLKVAK
jgi:hypothetical protein